MTNFLRLGEYNFTSSMEDSIGRQIVNFDVCNIEYNVEPMIESNIMDYRLFLSDYSKMNMAKYSDDKYNFIDTFNSLVDTYNNLFTQTKYNTFEGLEFLYFDLYGESLDDLSLGDKLDPFCDYITLVPLLSMIIPSENTVFNTTHGFVELIDDLTGLNLDRSLEILCLPLAVFCEDDRKTLYELIDYYAGGTYVERYRKELEIFLDRQRKTELLLPMPKIRYSSYDAPSYVK